MLHKLVVVNDVYQYTITVLYTIQEKLPSSSKSYTEIRQLAAWTCIIHSVASPTFVKDFIHDFSVIGLCLNWDKKMRRRRHRSSPSLYAKELKNRAYSKSFVHLIWQCQTICPECLFWNIVVNEIGRLLLTVFARSASASFCAPRTPIRFPYRLIEVSVCILVRADGEGTVGYAYYIDSYRIRQI